MQGHRLAVHGREGHPGSNGRIARAVGGRTSSTGLGFGPHLVYDGFGCPASRLEDLDDLYRLLDTLPERIHMTKIIPPYVFRHQSVEGADGYSGFVLIAESHISVHAFPKRNYVNADIFSCEPFDVETALAELTQAFLPRRVEWKLFDRGRERSEERRVGQECRL